MTRAFTFSVHRSTFCMLVALATLTAASACGTAVYEHRIQLSVDDPNRKLGPPPVSVSIFDHQMGYSEDWAKRSMRSTSTDAPYVESLTTTGTAAIGSSALPKQVTIAVAIPTLSTEGYYLFTADMPAEQERAAQASFVRYGSYFPDAGAPAIGVRYRAEPEKKGWKVFVIVVMR